MEKLTIISVGLGDFNLLTNQAIELISKHKNIYISEERFSYLKEINPYIKIISYSKLQETISKSQKDIAIIVSGDYGFYSLAKTFIRIFSNSKQIELINGISSIQYFASKLGMVYHDWVSLSLHGSNINKLPAYVTYNEKVFILTGGKYSVSHICDLLLEAGFLDLEIFVGENLSYENENICFSSLEQLKNSKFNDLTVMLIKNPSFVNHFSSYSNFVNSKIPLTNHIFRTSLISSLKLEPDDVVYNFGAGCGDLSVGIAKKVYSGLVYAFEEDLDCFNIMQKNKIKNFTFNIFNFISELPFFKDNFPNLLPPNKVLISKNFESIKSIFDWIFSFNYPCRVVLNTNSLEKLNISLDFLKSIGLNPQVDFINSFSVDENEAFLQPNNPSFIISVDINY